MGLALQITTFLMNQVSHRLYWTAVGANVLAFGTLLRGTVSPLTKPEQIIAILLTGISLICWILYFRKVQQ
jgi:hypothetical protein